MSFNAALFLALRYLKPQWSFVSVITFLSILGPILGVAILIVVIAVMGGFSHQLRQKIFSMQAHAKLQRFSAGEGNPIADPEPALKVLRGSGFRAAPVVEGPVLIQTRPQLRAYHVSGTRTSADPRQVSALLQRLQLVGRTPQAGHHEALVGDGLAARYNVSINDLLVMEPGPEAAAGEGRRQFRVLGYIVGGPGADRAAGVVAGDAAFQVTEMRPETEALRQAPPEVVAKFVKGVGLAAGETVSDLHHDLLVAGQGRPGPKEAIVGEGIARQYALAIGDKLVIHSTGRLKEYIKIADDGSVTVAEPDSPYLPEELTVVGVFAMGMYDYDANLILTDLETGDDLFSLDWGAATSIQVWTADPFNLNALYTLQAEAPELADLEVLSWRELNQQLFGALATEKSMQFFLLTGIMVVAGFCITATLITVVIQKTREIGVMKALGATPVTVLSVFLFQGAVIGVVGTGLGTALGLVVVRYRNELARLFSVIFGREVFPRELYQFSEIPARVDLADLRTITLCSFVICVIAGLLPAIYAAVKTPSDALKTDA